MKPTDNSARSMYVASLAGPLRSILIPEGLGFRDHRELGRAIAAWKYGLSRDEVRLLEYIAAGFTNPEIAAELCLAEENTVKNRLKGLFRKLGIRHRTQAATIAALHGIGGVDGVAPDS